VQKINFCVKLVCTSMRCRYIQHGVVYVTDWCDEVRSD